MNRDRGKERPDRYGFKPHVSDFAFWESCCLGGMASNCNMAAYRLVYEFYIECQPLKVRSALIFNFREASHSRSPN